MRVTLTEPPPAAMVESAFKRVSTKEAEAFRLTRANVELAAGDHRLIMLSAVEREVDASPSIAANLALALARNSKRTILVDLDVRRGALDRVRRVQVYDDVRIPFGEQRDESTRL